MESMYVVRGSDDTSLAVAMMCSDKIALGMVGRNVWMLDIIRVYSEAQGVGLGSRLLAHIVLEADKEAATLVLSVDPLAGSGMTHRKLRDWYRRYGFSSTITNINRMRRLPRGEADQGAPEVQHAYERHEGCLLCVTKS